MYLSVFLYLKCGKALSPCLLEMLIYFRLHCLCIQQRDVLSQSNLFKKSWIRVDGQSRATVSAPHQLSFSFGFSSSWVLLIILVYSKRPCCTNALDIFDVLSLRPLICARRICLRNLRMVIYVNSKHGMLSFHSCLTMLVFSCIILNTVRTVVISRIFCSKPANMPAINKLCLHTLSRVVDKLETNC